jgi:hypothetical protein
MTQMPTNGLTKALPAQKHATFVWQLNLVDILKRLRENEGKEAPDDDNNAYDDTNGLEHKQE